MAERALARRAAQRIGGHTAADSESPEALRTARLGAKRSVEQRGGAYAVARLLTWIMKLDIVLFSRVETGPFFALLVNEQP